MNSNIILFDGVCNLCNASINFIIDRDKNNVFKFASLQSETGQLILEKFGLNGDGFGSVVLIENDKFYTQSAAALRIAKQLKGHWKFLYVLIIIPPPLRNFLYDFVARNRYKWFGRKDSCRVPTPALKDKFL